MPQTYRTTGYTAKPRNPVYSVGKQYRTIPARISLTNASMTNGDLWIMAGPFTYADRIARVFSPNATPALTAAADNDLGFFYKKPDGTFAELDKDILWDGVTLAAALSTRDLLFNLNASLDSTKNIGELLGKGDDQEPFGGVYLGLTFNTKPTADGALDLDVVVEEATTE